MSAPLLLSPGVLEYHRKLAHDSTATAAELGCGMRAMVGHAEALMEIVRRVAERDPAARVGVCPYFCNGFMVGALYRHRDSCAWLACKALVTP